MLPPNQLPEIKLDATQLYREEVFTDRAIGTIRVLTPVHLNGEFDISRNVLYSGQTQLMTAAGPLPLAFDIDASNLDDAVAKFGDAAKAALEHMMEEMRELRRQQASSIVIPGQEPGMGGMGGMGGKFRMP
jgi:hypothetical protein